MRHALCKQFEGENKSGVNRHAGGPYIQVSVIQVPMAETVQLRETKIVIFIDIDRWSLNKFQCNEEEKKSFPLLAIYDRKVDTLLIIQLYSLPSEQNSNHCQLQSNLN